MLRSIVERVGHRWLWVRPVSKTYLYPYWLKAMYQDRLDFSNTLSWSESDKTRMKQGR